MTEDRSTLFYKPLGIDTQQEFVVFMRADCHVCRSEGFEAMTRLKVKNGKGSIVATLNVVHSELLRRNEASLSTSAAEKLRIKEGEELHFDHLDPIPSLSDVRSKMYGNKLSHNALDRIITDITHDLYSSVHLSAFVTACAGDNLGIVEIVGLTQAMVKAGRKLEWPYDKVVDKHCVGGLPGNRTTPIIVPIIASAGLVIPKTSSKAITSPAGTADTVGTFTNVNLDLEQARSLIDQEGGFMIWGDIIRLSPADDTLARIERALDVDSEGQMIASVLSKKAAAGSTHVVIDIPVGETAKVRSQEDALKLKYYFSSVAMALGLEVDVIITNGDQPVGRGIGPALEAKDVISVLKREDGAPKDLTERAITIAGSILELSGKESKGTGEDAARRILDSGKAYEKFMRICEAQGGFRDPGSAEYIHEIKADRGGRIVRIDNRRLANIAKLAGAPADPCAGVEFFAPLDKQVKQGEILFRIHSESRGELEYALTQVDKNNPIIKIE